jgi:hypothetical protein
VASAADGEARDLQLVAAVHRPRDAVDALLGVGQHLDARPALEQRGQVDDVVAVVVGEQHVRRA